MPGQEYTSKRDIWKNLSAHDTEYQQLNKKYKLKNDDLKK